jgi:hypothetical protein
VFKQNLQLVFNFAFEYDIWRVQENQEGLILSGIHQLLACADDTLVGENMGNIHKNTKALLDACNEFGLEVNPEKTTHILISRYEKDSE